MNLYNMSAPPRSQVVFDFIDNNDYYILSIDYLLKKLKCAKRNFLKRVNKYYLKNKNIIDKDIIGKYITLKELNKEDIKKYKYITDCNVILSILLRTYDGLYIPNKDIYITLDRLKVSYLINKEDLDNGK